MGKTPSVQFLDSLIYTYLEVVTSTATRYHNHQLCSNPGIWLFVQKKTARANASVRYVTSISGIRMTSIYD